MSEQTARAPDFKGQGYSIWVNYDETNNQYLSIKDRNGPNIRVYRFEKKEEFTNTEKKEEKVEVIKV